MYKTVELSSGFSLSICYFQKKKLILFKIKNLVYYKMIPYIYLFCKKQKNIFLIKTSKTCLRLYSYSIFVNTFVTFQVVNRKVIVLKGLGLKARRYFLKKIKVLELKLGFSHLCKVKYSKEIFLKIRKLNIGLVVVHFIIWV